MAIRGFLPGIWVGACALFLGACGGSVQNDTAAKGAGGSGALGGASGTGATGGSAGDSGAPGGGGCAGSACGDGGSASLCDAAAYSIAAEIAPAQGSCTTVVRVADDAGAPGDVGAYHVFCGGYATTDEATARAQAKGDTGVMGGCVEPSSLTGPTPNDDFVFYQPPTLFCDNICCGNGWLTAASARNALTLFGATLGVGTDVGPSYPASWQSASTLLDCSAMLAQPAARGFDLTGASTPTGASVPLDPALVGAALASVWHTAIPAGIAKKQGLFDAVVLRYEYQADNAAGTEWVVFLNSGWLE